MNADNPKTIVMDDGSEMTGLAMLAWEASHRVRSHYIAQGKPIQNAFIESFNGRNVRPHVRNRAVV
jgi:putative transposase